MTKIIPYITLNGNCGEAVTFYEKIFQARNLGIMRFGDTENTGHPLPDEVKSLIMHAAIEFEGNKIMFSDAFPGNPITPGSTVSIAIVLKNVERSTAIYNALSEGGEILMELQQTSWSPAYGMVRDKFGITWQIDTETEQA